MRSKTNDYQVGFNKHLQAYILVNLFLIALNVWHHDVWWFYFPMIGMTIGLIAHALALSGGRNE